MSNYQQKIPVELSTGAEAIESRYSIDDFKGFDFEVQTKKGINCFLCGYDLGFGFEVVGGNKIPIRYAMQAKDFPPKGNDKNAPASVLPEIMLKLVTNEVVDVVNKTEIEKPKVEKPKTV